MYHFCISITLRSDYGHLLISVLFSSVALNRGRRLLEGCTYVETRGLLKEIRYIYLAHTKNLYRTNCTFKNTFGIIFPEFIDVFCMCLGIFRYVVVIRQTESQNGCLKKTKHAKFSEKWTFLTPHVCISGGKKCLLFGKFSVHCLLETPILRFALLPYYWRCVPNNSMLKVLRD